MTSESGDSPEKIKAETQKWLHRHTNVYSTPKDPAEDHGELLDVAESRVFDGSVSMAQFAKDADFISAHEEAYGRDINPYTRNAASVKLMQDVLDIRGIRVLGEVVQMHSLIAPSEEYDQRSGKPDSVSRDRWNEEAIKGFFEQAEYPSKWGKVWIEPSEETLMYRDVENVVQDLVDASDFHPKLEIDDCYIYLLLMQRDGIPVDYLLRMNPENKRIQLLFDMTKSKDE